MAAMHHWAQGAYAHVRLMSAEQSRVKRFVPYGKQEILHKDYYALMR